MNQRGFIDLPAMAWGAIAAGVVIVGLGAAVKFQSYRLETCKTAFETFKAQVVAQGELAAKAAKATEIANQKAKEQADAKTKRLLADNADLAKRLRDARANSNIVPPAAPGSSRPNRATFDRAKLERALQFLDAGVSDLIAEGDGYRLKLSTASEWAKSIGK